MDNHYPYSVCVQLREFCPIDGSPQHLCWQPSLAKSSASGLRMALLDCGIAWHLPIFREANLTVRDFTATNIAHDPTGHGTKVAALLVANDGQLFSGLTPDTELLVAKVIDASAQIQHTASAIANGLLWAVHEGAQIIALPLGRAEPHPAIGEAVQYAINKGCRLFAAAGNYGPETMLFPAMQSRVTAVSAADRDGQPLDWCCQRSSVDLYAPGHRLQSIGPDGLSTISGTSPATVIAAGVEALRLSAGAASAIKN